jgi:hypothetical protein
MKTFIQILLILSILPALSFAGNYQNKKIQNKRLTCQNNSISWCKQHPCKDTPADYCAKKYPQVAP